MFTFGFSRSSTEKGGGETRDGLDGKLNVQDEDSEEKSGRIDWFPAAEIEVTDEQIRERPAIDDYTEFTVCDEEIKIIRSDNLILALNGEDHENILKAESQHSDLLPAVYEGGLKIWECSYDLGKYLIESGPELEGKRVLDLGCGAGVLGILALLKGSRVHFQDYNAEVIKLWTIPNVLLNLEDGDAARCRCEFYSGDWESFVKLSSSKYTKEEEKYDVIVTSETIYNPANQTKLYEVFKQRLRQKGVGYVAGKTYYFGVGGGMRQFETLVRDEKFFDVETVWKSEEGLQREIIKLTRRTSV